MAPGNPQRSVLLIGKSQLVLEDSVRGLRALGYTAQATSDFADVTARFDAREIDLVVFGGQVPSDRKTRLREEIGAINPRVIFVQGLAGIPGLIISQVRGAFAGTQQDPAAAPSVTPERTIILTLGKACHVTVTAWWQTSFAPPHPKSDSLLLLDDRLAPGDHAVAVPDHIPRQAAYATVQIDAAIYALDIAADR